ncbi:MAG: NINE protein [Muribaculum sp.]|nr:NINE protein [Muribaculum sp.]
MATSSIKCPECGGDKTTPMGANKYQCQYCGTTFTNVTETAIPAVPQGVTYCKFCGGEISVTAQKCRHCGEWLNQPTPSMANNAYQQNMTPQYVSTKSKGVAALLAILLAGWGIHEFYLGKTGAGIAYLLIWFCFCWTIAVPIILAGISIIQGISYLCMSDKEFAAKYH